MKPEQTDQLIEVRNLIENLADFNIKQIKFLPGIAKISRQEEIYYMLTKKEFPELRYRVTVQKKNKDQIVIRIYKKANLLLRTVAKTPKKFTCLRLLSRAAPNSKNYKYVKITGEFANLSQSQLKEYIRLGFIFSKFINENKKMVKSLNKVFLNYENIESFYLNKTKELMLSVEGNEFFKRILHRE